MLCVAVEAEVVDEDVLPSTGVDRLLFVVLERVDAGVRLVLLVWLVAVAADSTDAEVLLTFRSADVILLLVVVAAAVVEEAMGLTVVMTLAVVDVVVLPDVLKLLEDAVIAVIMKKDRSFQAHSGREHSTHCKLRKRMQIEKNKRKLRKIHQGCFKGTQRSDEPDCSSMLCEVQSPLTSSRLQ